MSTVSPARASSVRHEVDHEDPTSRLTARQLEQATCRTSGRPRSEISRRYVGTNLADIAAQTTGAERGLRRHHSQSRGGTSPMKSPRENTISTGTTLVGLTLIAALATAG